ncbi:MAG: SurA N-terminal domain-containing protein [Methylobacteriaceae bacterium]|nr:SurA N-terminal domain-containing protein [Methylobacteriaceae bacterium]
MLQNLRSASNTWLGRAVLSVVMGFIIISFAIWGIGNIFQGFGQNHLASVGNSEITINAYRNAYQAALQNIQRRTGQALTNDQARLFGLDQQVLGELVSNAAIDQQARALGLAMSDKEIRDKIFADPTYKGPSGAFDPNLFAEIVRDQGYSEQGFVSEQRQVYLRREIAEAIAGAVTTPRAALEAFNRYRAEARTVDYVVLPPKAAGEIAAPPEDELKKYFEDRKQAYRAPEYRKLIVLTVTPTLLAKPDAVSDEDAMKRYEEVKQRYGTPEKRDLQQIVFPDEVAARAAQGRIKAGASFEDIAAERKLSPTDLSLGTRVKGDLVDKAVADAAFALPEGGVTEPVKGTFGFVLVRVVKIYPESVKPFAEVAKELKAEIAADRARGEVTKLHDQIEDLRTSGKPLSEAAKAAGLEPRIIDAVDAAGRDKSGAPVADLTERDALMKAAFASDIGVDNETVETADNGYIWFEVQKIEPARDRTLDEVKGDVEKAWRSDETAKRLAEKAADLVKKLDAGETLQSIATAESVEVKTATGVVRAGAPGLPASAVVQIFGVSPGQAGSAAGDGDSRILFKVKDSVVPPLDPATPQTKSLAEAYAQSLSNDITAQYAGKVQAEVGVSVSEQALRLAIGGNNQ